MSNLLNLAPDYQITRTASGFWRRYLYSNGALYSEYTSHSSFAGWPLVHIARGRSPETGRVITARGVIAIGQKAVGVLAIGQAAIGIVALGQAAAGMIAIGQAACGILLGVGQVATGIVAIGQFAVGAVGFAQMGWGPSSLHTMSIHSR